MKRKPAIIILAVMLCVCLCAAPETRAEEPADPVRGDVFVFSVYRPEPATGKCSIACIDSAGDLWFTEEAKAGWPFRAEDVLDIIRTRQGMQYRGNVIDDAPGDPKPSLDRLSDIAGMVWTAEPSGDKPRKTGIDTGLESVYAVRTDADDNEEAVLLGMAGSYVLENTSPDAQALYGFMQQALTDFRCSRTESFGLANAVCAPQGFRAVTVRAFFGMENVDIDKAVITGAYMDCEIGPVEVQAAEEDLEEIRDMARRGLVTGKANNWLVTGGTVCWYFSDGNGEILGCMELYDGMAVAGDGMYDITLLPAPADGLTEPETKLCSFRLDGIEYTAGKSTPRDLILNGWHCRREWDGTFSFRDPELNNRFQVTTAGGTMDEPIETFSSGDAPNLGIEYCGADGYTYGGEPDSGDPETARLEHWAQEMGAEKNEAGGLFLTRTLSNGRTLTVYFTTHPVEISIR